MANITFKYADKPKLAELCIKHRLYIPGWSMISDLEGIKRGFPSRSSAQMQVAFEGDRPIAVMLLTEDYHKQKDVQVFVRAAHRRKGIATKMFHRLTNRAKVHPRQLKFGPGVVGSDKFFYSVGL